MKRPQRNLFAILSALAVLWLVLLRVPGLAALWLLVALCVFWLGLSLYARDLFIGRFRARRRQWREAIESYAKFEKQLGETGLGSVLIPIYLSIYSFDGVAIARNNIGRSLIELKEFADAEHWLRAALQRDPLFALPYTGLGTIAALRGDAKSAEREFRRAVELGFNPTAAQTLLRRALEQAEKKQEE
jgi:tetratricopeptide (TPR) repeat protein